jgi:prepilin-type processing-associated H-X9-DG protein
VTSLPVELAQWIEVDSGAALVGTCPIAGGASRLTWAVDLSDGRQLIVREDTGTGPVAGTPLDLRREATVYRALRASGLRLPALYGVAPDGMALLLARAPGSPDLSAADDDERAAVTRDYLAQLGILHLLDPHQLELGSLEIPTTGPDHARDDIALWQSILDTRTAGHTTPAAAFGLTWLRDNAPARSTRTSLCHGDAGPGNFLYADGQVTALLDWEFAHVGDPLDDLAWVAVRNQVLGSPMDLSLAFAAWRATTGLDVDLERLEYYRALVLLRMLVSCDAAVCWTAGVETESNRTQVVLRPFLARAVCHALRIAGCADTALDALEPDAEAAWTGSPLTRVFGAHPTLADLGAAL